jgi:hypothetical protein
MSAPRSLADIRAAVLTSAVPKADSYTQQKASYSITSSAEVPRKIRHGGIKQRERDFREKTAEKTKQCHGQEKGPEAIPGLRPFRLKGPA